MTVGISSQSLDRLPRNKVFLEIGATGESNSFMEVKASGGIALLCYTAQ